MSSSQRQIVKCSSRIAHRCWPVEKRPSQSKKIEGIIRFERQPMPFIIWLILRRRMWFNFCLFIFFHSVLTEHAVTVWRVLSSIWMNERKPFMDDNENLYFIPESIRLQISTLPSRCRWMMPFICSKTSNEVQTVAPTPATCNLWINYGLISLEN